MNELIAVAITGSVTFCIGILAGMSLQWRRNEPRVNLANIIYAAYLRGAALTPGAPIPSDVGDLEKWLLDLQAKSSKRQEDDLDDDDFDDFDQDDPEYVAGVEATLRAWAEADKAEGMSAN